MKEECIFGSISDEPKDDSFTCTHIIDVCGYLCGEESWGLVLWAPKISIVSLGLLWSNVENPDIIPIKTFLLGKEGKSLDELSYHTLFYAMEVVGLGLMAPTRKTVFLHWAEILCIQKTLTLLWDGWLRQLPRFSLPCF